MMDPRLLVDMMGGIVGQILCKPLLGQIVCPPPKKFLSCSLWAGNSITKRTEKISGHPSTTPWGGGGFGQPKKRLNQLASPPPLLTPRGGWKGPVAARPGVGGGEGMGYSKPLGRKRLLFKPLGGRGGSLRHPPPTHNRDSSPGESERTPVEWSKKSKAFSKPNQGQSPPPPDGGRGVGVRTGLPAKSPTFTTTNLSKTWKELRPLPYPSPGPGAPVYRSRFSSVSSFVLYVWLCFVASFANSSFGGPGPPPPPFCPLRGGQTIGTKRTLAVLMRRPLPSSRSATGGNPTPPPI